jgi:hypothetical protein
MAYSLYTRSFGSENANAKVYISEEITGLPAIILSNSTGGLVSDRGFTTLNSSGKLSAYLDVSRKWVITIIDENTVPIDGTKLTTSQASAAIRATYGVFGYESDKADRARAKQREFFELIAYPAIYFDPSLGADTGDGSPGNPFRDFTAARLVPGRRHLIKRGTTITCGSGTWLTTPSTATTIAPIIIGAYGDSNLARPIINGAASTMVIRHGTNSKNIRIRDLDVIGPQAGSAGTARLCISTNIGGGSTADIEARLNYYNIIERCKVRSVVTEGTVDCNGIKLYGADCEILDCEVQDIATDGIWFHGDRMLIQGCTVMRVGQDGRNAGDCIQCGSQSDNSVIRGNLLDHRSADYKQCIYFEAEGGGGAPSTGVIIEDNICYGYDGTTGNHTPIFALCYNAIVRRNFVTGGSVGIRVGPRGIAHNNIIFATVGNGMSALNEEAQIYHNTVIQTGSQSSQTFSCGIRAGSSSAYGNVARNNVIIGFYYPVYATASTGLPGTNTLIESHNAFGIIGVNQATYWVSGNVPPTNALIDSSTTAAATFGLDSNYRPTTNYLSSIASVSTTDGLDKDQQILTAVRGAFGLIS